MTFGIIGAMDEEIELLQNKMANKQVTEIANSMFIEGSIGEKHVILVKSGIGKVNAAMTTTILMERFHPAQVINTGSAGGFSESLNVGDVVISTEVVHHDVDVTAFDYEYGQVPQMPPAFKANESLVRKTEEVLSELNIKSEHG